MNRYMVLKAIEVDADLILHFGEVISIFPAITSELLYRK
jgi:hypothetical protein